MSAYAPNPVADASYDGDVRFAFIRLTEAILAIEDPLERLGVIARLEERLKPVLDSIKTFAVRDARDRGETLAAVGAALGVSHQRAHQIATNNVPQEDTTP